MFFHLLICFYTHSFLPATCQPASGLCFLACSPMKKHTTCVFSLAYLLLHTIFSPLPAYQLPGWVFSLAFLYPSPRRGFFRSHSTPHAQLSPRYLPISFRAGFSRLLFSTQAHAVGFSARILLLTPSFLSATYPLASWVGFLACFSLPAPTPWVFPLAFYSSRPAFSPLPAYQLPGWVFSLAFLYPSPRRGFFRSHSTPHAQFSLRYLPISFLGGFSRLLFSSCAHAVGFSAHLLLLTPSFLSVTYQSASGVSFHACFSLPAPTTWVFTLANTRAHQFNKMYLTMRSNSYIICLEFRSS